MNQKINSLTALYAIIAFLMLATHTSAQECGEYEVTVIAGPQCGDHLTSVIPQAISETGDVVGYTSCNFFVRAFYWTPKDGLQFIPMPDGTFESKALAISGTKIVGYRFIDNPEFGQLAFLYDYATDEFTTMWPLPGAIRSEAHAINSSGEIVGFFGGGDFTSPQAFIWRDGEMIDLNPDFGTVKSEANGITNAGLVTGWMGTSFLTDARAYIWDEGKVIELPEIPDGITSEGEAINAQGDVVGRGRFFDKELDAIVWRTFAFIDGKAIRIDPFPGCTTSLAHDINNAQTVVGASSDPGGDAFIWEDGVLTDLNDLVSPSKGLRLDTAKSINQAGQILSQGHSDPLDATVAIIMSPIIGLPGDLNSDCQITTADLLLLLGSWGSCNGCPADLDGNGSVGTSDLLILLSNWG